LTTEELLPLLAGPYGALFLAFVVIVALYRLYREERADGRVDRQATMTLTKVVEELTREIRAHIEFDRQERERGRR
jgi:hypothetical protein